MKFGDQAPDFFYKTFYIRIGIIPLKSMMKIKSRDGFYCEKVKAGSNLVGDFSLLSRLNDEQQQNNMLFRINPNKNNIVYELYQPCF